MWMPKASENASATAIVNIPPMTAIFRFVPKLNQIMSPSVVMIHEVIQNDNQVLIDCFMLYVKKIKKLFPSSRYPGLAIRAFSSD